MTLVIQIIGEWGTHLEKNKGRDDMSDKNCILDDKYIKNTWFYYLLCQGSIEYTSAGEYGCFSTICWVMKI